MSEAERPPGQAPEGPLDAGSQAGGLPPSLIDDALEAYAAQERTIDVAERELASVIGQWKFFIREALGDSSIIVTTERRKDHHFEATQGRLNIDPARYLEEGRSVAEIIWTILHETQHFRQMIEDPDAYLRNFRVSGEKAEEYGRQYDEDVVKRVKAAFNRMRNVLSDVNVNSRVEDVAPSYGNPAGKQPLVRELYRTKLIPRTELRVREDPLGRPQPVPRCYQFMNAIIRQQMVPDEPVEVDPEVRERLEAPIQAVGEQYTLAEFLRTHICQPTGRFRGVGRRGSESYRNYVVELPGSLMERFEELLRMDLEDQRLADYVPGDGDGGVSDLDLGPDDLKKVADFLKKDLAKRRRTPEQRAADQRLEQFLEWAREAGFTPEQIELLNRVREATDPLKPVVARIFHRLMQPGESLYHVETSRHKFGRDIDMNELVAQLPTVLTKPDQARIMKQTETESRPKDEPDEIYVILLLDQSGSMHGDDGRKKQAVREVTDLLAGALEQFAQEREQRGVPVTVGCQAIRYGSEAPVESLPSQSTGDRRRDIAQAVLDVDKGMGSTEDAPALSIVEAQLTPRQRERIRTGTVKVFLFEITDGDTQTEAQTQAAIERLQAAGVVAKGIQILEGGFQSDVRPDEAERDRQASGTTRLPARQGHQPAPVSQPEGAEAEEAPERPEEIRDRALSTFEKVWGRHGLALERIEDLSSVVTRLLAEQLHGFDR